MWDYDTNDWQVGETSESVDAMYQVLINDAGKGLFDTVSTILCAQQAVNPNILDQRDGPHTRA